MHVPENNDKKKNRIKDKENGKGDKAVQPQAKATMPSLTQLMPLVCTSSNGLSNKTKRDAL